MRVELRPTVPADLAQVTHQPLPIRIRAITALAGDQVLGIGGIGYRPDGVVIAFMHINEPGRRYPRAIHRAGLAAMELIRQSGERCVIAMADELVEPARRWLERLGFRATHEDGVEFYVWRSGGN